MGNSIASSARAEPTGQKFETTTLATVLDDLRLERIDYLNIQLNGAELDALHGLGFWVDKVSTFFVATPHTIAGGATRPGIVKFLSEAGFSVVDDGREGRVVAHRA